MFPSLMMASIAGESLDLYFNRSLRSHPNFNTVFFLNATEGQNAKIITIISYSLRIKSSLFKTEK